MTKAAKLSEEFDNEILNTTASKYRVNIKSWKRKGGKLVINVDQIDKSANGPIDDFIKDLQQQRLSKHVVVIGPNGDFVRRYIDGSINKFEVGVIAP